MKKITIISLCYIFWAFINNAEAIHDVYLQTPNSIPSYCQEASNWCGAATSQMVLEGYPGGVEHAFTQSHIWNRIQVHKDDSSVSWATDPDGLRDTLMELGGDTGVHWSIFSNPNAQSLMHSVTYWMTRRNFPTAALVNTGGSPYGSFQHWILIQGFTTDVDPSTNSTVNLQFIEIVDPWNPPCSTATHGGVTSLMTGANWYLIYWDVPGNLTGSKWNGNYVAVIEPPLKEGIAKAPKQVAEGRPISEKAAGELAAKWIEEYKLYKKEPYSILQHNKLLQPLLVNRKYKGYYIVPLGYEKGQISQGAVVINAYTGEFQEIGVFHMPVKYISRDRAIKLALSYLCACKDVKKAMAELVFRHSEETQSRYLPAWQITYLKQVVFVTMDGKVLDELTPIDPGD